MALPLLILLGGATGIFIVPIQVFLQARPPAEQKGRMIACVSHCDIIRGIIAYHLGLPLDHMLRFDVDPASVSRIALGAWGARIMTVNERLYQ